MRRLVSALTLSMAIVAAAPTTGHAVGIDLLSDAHLRLDGGAVNDLAGISVSGAGDVNGDGRADVIVSAVGTDYNGRAESGAAYVIYGAPVQTTLDLTVGPSVQRGFRIDGAVAGDGLGSNVAGVGDVNNDGYDDVAVGATGSDPFSRSNAGSTYIIYGAPQQSGPDLVNGPAANRGFRIDGAAASDQSGTKVAGAGDVNGDGFDDVIVGAPLAAGNTGAAYVVYGAASQAPVDLANLGTHGFRIDGPAGNGFAGSSVAGVGDLNGDGRSDVIVGAPNTNARGLATGSAYVVYGAASQGTLALGTGLAGRGFLIAGAAASTAAGSGVSGAGDVNGDGHPDIVVGALGSDLNARADSGSAYVIYGGAPAQGTVDLATALGSAGFRIDGAAAGEELGGAVSGAGDVNGDGHPDIVLGASNAGSPGRSLSGAAYVVYGATSQGGLDLATAPALRAFRIEGPNNQSRAGEVVSGAGDFTGDGRADVIISGAQATPHGVITGAAYVVSADFLPTVAYDPVTTQPGQAVDVGPTALSASLSATLAISPPLPAGLTFNTATGRITGTPTTAGITHHIVTVTDPTRGVSQSALTVSVVNAQGPAGQQGPTGAAGPQGATGAVGPQGAPGTNGQTGAVGPTGASGQNGAAGAAGPAGPAGAQGPAGRNARVKCTVAAKKRRPKVTCKVKRAARSAVLSRRGRVYARGSARHLRGVRRLQPGRYVLDTGRQRFLVTLRRAGSST